LSDCDVGGSVESLNEGREDMGDMGDMGDMDNVISDINTFCGVDSDFSVGSVLGDDDYEEDQDVFYSSLSEESDIEENELNNEAALLNFTAQLTQGMEAYMEKEKRPSHYNVLGKKAPRTKQRHRAEWLKRTKALRAQGYSDISSYFESNGDEDLEFSDMDMESLGTSLREEEEEEEEEEEITKQAQRLQSMQEEKEATDDKLEISYQSRSVQSFPYIGNTDLDTLISDPGEISEIPATIQAVISLSEPLGQSIVTEQCIEENISVHESISQHVKSQHACRTRPPSKSSTLILNGIKVLEKKAKNKTLDLVFRGRL